MQCERIKELIGEHLDGCLDADSTREMNDHLAGCSSCRREFEELRQTVTLLRGLDQLEPPADLVSSVRGRLAKRSESPAVVFWNILSLPQMRVAAAASLLIVIGVYAWRTMMMEPGVVEKGEGIASDRIAIDVAATKQAPVTPAMPAATNPAKVLSAKKAGNEPAVMADASVPVPAPAVSVPRPQPSESMRRLAVGADKNEKSHVPGGEARGQIWRQDDVERGRQSKARAVGGLTAGEALMPAEELADHSSKDLPAASSQIQNESAVVLQVATEAMPNAKAAGSRDNSKNAEDGFKSMKGAARKAAPVAAAKLAADCVMEAKEESQGREVLRSETASTRPETKLIALAASDVSAVRKIMDRYAVPAEGIAGKEAGALADESDGKIMITGWVPAARYAQFVESLKSIGSVLNSADSKETVPSDGSETKKQLQVTKSVVRDKSQALLFVKITIVSSAK